jgi:hypothetical protein
VPAWIVRETQSLEAAPPDTKIMQPGATDINTDYFDALAQREGAPTQNQTDRRAVPGVDMRETQSLQSCAA